MGGPGSEREVSLRSAANVAAGLRAAGALVTEVDVRGDDFILPVGTELAFNVIHGTYGEDGALPRELERRGVAYTGEGVEISRLAFDKILSKNAFVAAGVPTPRSEIIHPGERPALGAPCVVKPPREGSSVGVHLCHNEQEITAALLDVARFGQDILVEELIAGAELTVGILGDEALPIIQIDGNYDYAHKYPWSVAGQAARAAGAAHVETLHLCPAPLPPEVTQRVQKAALAAHRALGCRTYSRVDLMLEAATGKPFVLEANTIPGMTESSLLPEAAKTAGIELPHLLKRMVTLSRQARP